VALEKVAQLGARLLLQMALEAEVPELLGSDCYQRRAAAMVATSGSHNGYSLVTINSTAGASPCGARSCGARPQRARPGRWARASVAPTSSRA